MAKSAPRCISWLLVSALFYYFQPDVPESFVSAGPSRASLPQRPQVSSAAYGGGGYGGGGYGGGGSSGQPNQAGSTILLFALIGGLMYVGWSTLENAESRGWNPPTYTAPTAAPAAVEKDRATIKQEAIRQIMAAGAEAKKDEFDRDRFQILKAESRVEAELAPNTKYDGSELPSSFPSLQRSPLNNVQVNSARNLLPERYGNSPRPINSAF